ncbi:MAG: hypothetical protein AAGJ93_08375 [Bacteroidota bacterium]
MIDKLLKTLQEAGGTIKEQAAGLGTGAREKTYAIIEDWLQIFPKLETYGLKVESFALGVAISPSVEVDLKGRHEDFTADKLALISLDAEKSDAAMRMVISTIKTAYKLHGRISDELPDPLIVKIRIKLSPEVKVFIGEPLIQ